MLYIFHQIILYDIRPHCSIVQSEQIIIISFGTVHSPAAPHLAGMISECIRSYLNRCTSSEMRQRLLPVHPDLVLIIKMHIEFFHLPCTILFSRLGLRLRIRSQYNALFAGICHQAVSCMPIFTVEILRNQHLRFVLADHPGHLRKHPALSPHFVLAVQVFSLFIMKTKECGIRRNAAFPQRSQ